MQTDPKQSLHKKVLEINKLLTRSIDLESILQTLVEAANEFVSTADTVILYLYDQDCQTINYAKGVGVDEEFMKHITFAPGESLTGKTYQKKETLMFHQTQDIRNEMINMSENNYTNYFQGVYKRTIKKAFCVPLLYQNDCLGVLAVDNFEEEKSFSNDDIEVIETIADQSAIAIVNAKLIKRLQSKNEELEHSLDIHNRFTEVILKGEGKQAILKVLERILQTSVTYQENKGSSHYSFPIIRGHDIFGYLHFDRPINTFTSLEHVSIEHASTAFALELVKQNALYERELHFREEIFLQMMDGMSHNEWERIFNYINIKEHEKVQCMILDGTANPLWSSESLLQKENLIKEIETKIKEKTPHFLVFTRGYQLIVLIPSSSITIMKNIAEQFLEKKTTLNPICGIGRSTTLNSIKQSYNEASETINYAKKTKKKGILFYTDLGAERLWHKVDHSTQKNFVYDTLGPVLDLPEEYMQTLSVYIEENRSHKETAQKLHIHPNTLYHRIKKIEISLDQSFQNDRDWMNITIAYYLYVSEHNN